MNSHVVLISRPGANGTPSEEHFNVEKCAPPATKLEPGEVTLRTCYLSVDPAMRCQMNADTGADYLSAWPVGGTVTGLLGLGVVECSNAQSMSAGDLIMGTMCWPWMLRFNDNVDSKTHIYQKLDATLLSNRPSLALATVVGITALIGLKEKGHVTAAANQTCFVSGAAGACGSIAGQIARLEGCINVVGSCGTDEKCKWLTESVGYNAAINYKTADLKQRLLETCPRGIDVYFDNVGGDISDKVIAQMNTNSHIVLCGQISQYNKDVPYPPPLPVPTQTILKEKNITRERFTVTNYQDQFQKATQDILSLIVSGKVKYRECIEEGLENAGKAFVSMMAGGNIGKQIVHVSDP